MAPFSSGDWPTFRAAASIELTNENNTGATQIDAAEFLGITYPTADVVSAMEAIGPGHGQPVVLIGERGQGKSHLLAALYHGFNSPEVTAEWLKAWGIRLGQPKLAEIKLTQQASVDLASVEEVDHAIAVAKAAFPAWRATKVDPMVALRYE